MNFVGLPLQALDTPSLIVERPALMRNLHRLMDSLVDSLKSTPERANPGTAVRVRAHAKSHKCPDIARLQIQHGAIGICCQKVSEAQVFAQAGIQNILISNEVVGPAKIERLIALAQQTDLTVCVDHIDNALALNQAFSAISAPLKVLVEIDVGQGRCGVSPGAPAVALIQAIVQMPGLSFQGLQAYHGSAQHYRLPSQRRAAIDQACAHVRDTVTRLQALGITCPTIAGAGTGSYLLESASGLYNEIQPGSYVFMDADYQRNQAQEYPEEEQTQKYSEEKFGDKAADRTSAAFEQSLFVWASVMSRPTADRAVVDAGLKAFSVDSGLPQVYGMTGVEYVKASDEHGVLRVTTTGNIPPNDNATTNRQATTNGCATANGYAMTNGHALQLGDKLRIIPGHCDPTVNLYDNLFVVENDIVVDVWPIAARGALY